MVKINLWRYICKFKSECFLTVYYCSVMNISVFEIFSIGIGPSSSHTVGPMRACRLFLDLLHAKKKFDAVHSICIECFGSLGLTGKGHGTDKALCVGLSGNLPENVLHQDVVRVVDQIDKENSLLLDQKKEISFHYKTDIIFNRSKELKLHPNGMRFIAHDKNGKKILKKEYYSIGGGFIFDGQGERNEAVINSASHLPYQFRSATDLLEICKKEKKKIFQIILENEKSISSEKHIYSELLKIWKVMQECVKRGYKTKGVLPGGLKVERRAHSLYKRLSKNIEKSLGDPLSVMDWVNLYALAVSEENAAGGRVVTAPTNGAAGVLPAVLHYYEKFHNVVTQEKIVEFLLTAAGIAMLYKMNASISGAEVGCQGEVGVACSMAAAGLVEVLGGTNEQIENAAEIGMEHNLGLTCDPIGGLVQIPCIERNAMGAMKAINAARIALQGDGKHFVSLDKVIQTMYETGQDMATKYKETSRGGLAINIVEC